MKREELVAMNSMILHEYYFDNLGGDGRPDSSWQKLLSRHFGSTAAWQHEFQMAGQSLSGGSGWVVLAYSPRDQKLVNSCSTDHAQTLAGGIPLLVMDMYEHAYQMDFGADAQEYIEAFFRNINWQEVHNRAAELRLV